MTSPAVREARKAQTGARLALGALVFCIVVAGSLFWYTNRTAKQAKADAVAEAARAKHEADQGLCLLIGLLIQADNPERTPVLREALRRAYTDPGCRPALLPNGKYPIPAPTPTPTPRPGRTVGA